MASSKANESPGVGQILHPKERFCNDCQRVLPNQIAYEKIESIISSMQDDQTGLPVKTAKSFMSKIPSVFTGSDLIQWMMRQLKLEDQQEAFHLANLIASYGYIFPIEEHTFSIKNDCTFYRFQTPCLWPSKNQEPENTDYAVYLCKRTMQGKTRLELADYEAENLARLQKMFSRKWEFIFMQAEAQAKVDKKRDKLERKVLDSQERAFWDVYRPVPGTVNTTELDIKKACRLSKSAKRCNECRQSQQKTNSASVPNVGQGISPAPTEAQTALSVTKPLMIEPPPARAEIAASLPELNTETTKNNQIGQIEPDHNQSGSKIDGDANKTKEHQLATEDAKIVSAIDDGRESKSKQEPEAAIKKAKRKAEAKDDNIVDIVDIVKAVTCEINDEDDLATDVEQNAAATSPCSGATTIANTNNLNHRHYHDKAPSTTSSSTSIRSSRSAHQQLHSICGTSNQGGVLIHPPTHHHHHPHHHHHHQHQHSQLNQTGSSSNQQNDQHSSHHHDIHHEHHSHHHHPTDGSSHLHQHGHQSSRHHHHHHHHRTRQCPHHKSHHASTRHASNRISASNQQLAGGEKEKEKEKEKEEGKRKETSNSANCGVEVPSKAKEQEPELEAKQVVGETPSTKTNTISDNAISNAQTGDTGSESQVCGGTLDGRPKSAVSGAASDGGSAQLGLPTDKAASSAAKVIGERPASACETSRISASQVTQQAANSTNASLQRQQSQPGHLMGVQRKTSLNAITGIDHHSTTRAQQRSDAASTGEPTFVKTGSTKCNSSAAASIKQQVHKCEPSVRTSGSEFITNQLDLLKLGTNPYATSSSSTTSALAAPTTSSINKPAAQFSGGIKMNKVTDSYVSYYNQWAEYDPFIEQPIPSNPWISDSTELWESERQTKEVHCRRVRRWAFSLKELLNDPAGREQFYRFLEKEFSAENLKFWDAVQELKRVHTRDVGRRVEAIWKEYLAQDANCPINIDSKSYETSKRNMDKNKNNRYIFDEAAGHVYQLMKNDSYPRYLRSDMYKDYREQSEKRRSNQVQVTFDVFKPQISNLKQRFNFN